MGRTSAIAILVGLAALACAEDGTHDGQSVRLAGGASASGADSTWIISMSCCEMSSGRSGASARGAFCAVWMMSAKVFATVGHLCLWFGRQTAVLERQRSSNAVAALAYTSAASSARQFDLGTQLL